MATGNAVDFKWYTYVDNNGQNWSMKVDKTWGDNAESGFTAHNAGFPAWPEGGFYRCRKAVFQDPVSGRTTTRRCGSATSPALTPGGSYDIPVRGAGGLLAVTSLEPITERRPRSGAIISKAEPITV